MKNILIYILIFLWFNSCKENSTTVIKPKKCNLPPQYTDNNNAPLVTGHSPGQLSPDGRKLLFSIRGDVVKVLDLKTLEVKTIDFESKLPSNMKLFASGGATVRWCPYDNNLVIASCGINVDTVGDGKNFVYGYQLVETTIDGSFLNIVTPKECGPAGAITIPIYAWLPSSTKGNDKFLIIHKSNNSWRPYSIYCPQSQTFESPNFNQPNGAQFRGYTYDMNYSTWIGGDKNTTRYYIAVNNNFLELIFKEYNISTIGFGAISPNRKKLGVGAVVQNSSILDTNSRLAEIWIIDLEKYLQNPVSPVPIEKIINLKEKFCMFSPGPSSIFISESTLVVNMFKGGYKEGDSFQYLYEIDLDGNLKRQLTFVP